MSDLRVQLTNDFRSQERFAAGYSPLYALLFGIVAGWLAAEEPDPVLDWLLTAAAERRPFDVTLLLPAALHRDVLAGVPAAAPLAPFYPSVGGTVPGAPAADLAAALRQVVLARGDALAAFIRRANVQTNETGRGLAWLLPLAALGWPAVHLLELGASAGLNLVAEQRAYRLADAAAPEMTLLALGSGAPPQFTTLARGRATLPPLLCCPTILSRTGVDLHPFPLATAEDELTLTAFLWADQVTRVDRLREGIAALRAVAATAAPVRLAPLRLPDELPGFLAGYDPAPGDAPVVVFNTTVTMYLPDRGAGLRAAIDAWAGRRAAPVLWLQWEPAGPDDDPPPEDSWFRWTADLWPNASGEHRRHHFQLAWVHPHGTALAWSPQIGSFLDIAMQI
ncbi:MAG: DUF2332 domain-containing protein [Anaerolineae bacterium]|nr:DUF2332 domain-containing protein [Anaerolineae bacterium]